MPPELQKTSPPMPDMSKVKFLPPRTGIVYRNNSGYNLAIKNLPWGAAPFGMKRYRISKTQNLDLVQNVDLVEAGSGKDGVLNLSNSFSPDTVELIVLTRR